MSEPIERDLPGDWWLFGGMVIAFLNYQGIRWRHRPLEAHQPIGVRVLAGSPLAPIATIEIIGNTGTSRLVITPESGHEDGMNRLANLLYETAIQGEDMRRAWTPTLDEVIERFYRSRSQGSRVTLRQLAQETGISYSTLTKRKMEYDRLGGWGSRKTLENTNP